MAAGAGTHLVDGDHVVQFYDDETGLVDVVGGYLAAALMGGDSVVVIATPEHRAVFERSLEIAGADLDAAKGDGHLVMLDAAETLARFMRAGMPDAADYDATVGSLVRDVASRGRPVRAYGEMVALLWSEGNINAAIELERLWNSLASTNPLSLFCAYPSDLVRAPATHPAFAEVCRLHSDVITGAPAPVGADVSRLFLRSLNSPSLARRFVRATLVQWGCDELADDAVIIAGELATNAVAHAGSSFTVSISKESDGVRLVVGDGSAAAPSPRVWTAHEASGRGLYLVGRLARSWGHDLVEGGKCVWVDLGPATERV